MPARPDTALQPQRPGFVVELQAGCGTLMLRLQTPSPGYALQMYCTYLRAAVANKGAVIVLHNEREITGAQLRAIVKESRNAQQA